MFSSAKLRQIVAIDRAGSFSAAARVLNVSQSTLTKAVADVETDLGLALFVRTARGVVATPEGREFINRAARIVSDFELLFEDAKTRRSQGDTVLRLGASPASQEGLYNRIIAKLLKARPEICLTLSGLPVERGIQLLKRGDLDVLMGPVDELRREQDFTVEPIGSIRAHLFCRKGHPILENENPTFADACKYKIISAEPTDTYAQRISQLLIESNLDPKRQMHIIENFAIVAEVVADTDILGIVSEQYSRTRKFRDRFVIPPVDVIEPLEIGAATLSRWLPSKAVLSFLEHLRAAPPTD